MSTRGTILKVSSAAPGAGTVTFKVAPPSWATRAILFVEATTAAASTVDAKIVQATPTGTATANVDVPGAAIDQVLASSTAVGRILAWGDQGAAAAGTSFDVVEAPLSKWQLVSYTLVGTVTNLKIHIEFEGP